MRLAVAGGVTLTPPVPAGLMRLFAYEFMLSLRRLVRRPLLAGLMLAITVSQIWQLKREFGIRMALGIEPARLWSRFVRGHLAGIAVAVVLGLGAALALAHVLRALLFGINERDPLTYVVAAAVILLVSALACIPSYFQLRRINPAECLRSL